jgi:hypothetical protein
MMPWQEMRTQEQNDLIHPACRDLARCLVWKGYALDENDWRALVCAAILGEKIVPGLTGGLVALGRSSKDLKKQQATDALTMIFSIGDAPWEYDPTQQTQVQWGRAVRMARGIPDNETQAPSAAA